MSANVSKADADEKYYHKRSLCVKVWIQRIKNGKACWLLGHVQRS